MKLLISLFCFFALIITICAPPINEPIKKDKSQDDSRNNENSDEAVDQLEYARYLKEVVEILEKDPEFKKKIENASAEDIKSGNISEYLSLVQHHIRTQLDEAKQREVARLKELVTQKFRNLSEKQRLALLRDPNGRRLKEFVPQHIDHNSGNLFNERDLERLIQHATKDLDALDRKREEQFKEYEMKKEYQRRAQLAKLSIDERKRLEKLHQEALEKRKHHPKVNHPGSVDQMEEVWEEVDKLEADQFTPKAFFKLHDIDGNDFLDEDEIEAIMLKEAAKIHDGAPEADLVEKQEEIERMRQHVMKEFDKNNDRMISLQEFSAGINGKNAKNDRGWKSIEDNTVYSDQEFQHFSEKLSPVSTSIPPHQTPSPAANQQPQVQPEGAARQPPPAPPQGKPESVARPPPPAQPIH